MTQRAKGVVGQTLGRTYRIERAIGVGSIGAVYVARHARTGGLCAVKVLHRRLAGSEAFERFVEEARLLSALRHPNIVSITDFDHDDNGTPFLVMDLLEGENLMQRLRSRGCLPLSQAGDILREVGSALSAAHRSGVVHRNIKPENIFLVRHDLGDRIVETVRLTDFGVARLRRADALPGGDPSLLGLSQYTPPEALQDPGAPLDGRADQWAMAVVLYRMLAGRLPFPGESLKEVLHQVQHEPPTPLSQLAPELPGPVAVAVARAMAKDREERYEQITDLVRAFCDRLPGGLVSAGPPPASAEPVTPPTPMPRIPLPLAAPREQHARGLWLAAASLLVLVAGISTALLVQREHRREGLAVVRPGPIVMPSRSVSPSPSPSPSLPTPVSPSPSPSLPTPVLPSPSRPAAAPTLVAASPQPERLPAPAVEPRPAGEPAPQEAEPEKERPPARPHHDREKEPEETAQPAVRDGRSPEQLLKDAQEAYVAGDKQQALSLALSAATQPGGHVIAAWRFLGTAACQARDLKLASRAYKRLDQSDRQFVIGICRSQGLAYLNGEFRPDTWPAP